MQSDHRPIWRFPHRIPGSSLWLTGPAVILWPSPGNDAREGLIHSSSRTWTAVFRSRVYHEGAGCPQQSHSLCSMTFSAHPGWEWGVPFHRWGFVKGWIEEANLSSALWLRPVPRTTASSHRKKTAMNWGFANQNLQLRAPSPITVSATLQKRPKPTTRNATRDSFFFYTEDSVQLPSRPLPLGPPDRHPAKMEESANSLERQTPESSLWHLPLSRKLQEPEHGIPGVHPLPGWSGHRAFWFTKQPESEIGPSSTEVLAFLRLIWLESGLLC